MSELTFAIDGDALLWTGDGEYLRIEPWGKNSVRVRASKMHEIQEQEGALLPQNNQASDSHDYGITIDKPNRTGRITQWRYCSSSESILRPVLRIRI